MLSERSFVTAIDRERVAEPEGAVLLRSYENGHYMNFEESCYLWEAALATCAAPIFFSPALVRGTVLVDGGLGHNNPTEHLLSEAEKRWPGRSIGAVVSIGTGKARGNLLARDMKKAAAGKHFLALVHVALVLKHIATSSEARERSVHSYFRGMGKLDCYYRLNVDKGMEIELHEYKRYGEIRMSTRDYLETRAVRRIVRACAVKLTGMRDPDVLPRIPQSLFRHPEISQDLGSSSTSETTIQRLAEDMDDSLTLEESGTLFKELLGSAELSRIELKPVYQLDLKRGSVDVRTMSLAEDSKLPLDRVVGHEANKVIGGASGPAIEAASEGRRGIKDRHIRPTSGLAFAVDTKNSTSRLIVEYIEAASKRKVAAGIWKVHWLLLFRRHSLGSKKSSEEARVDFSEDARSEASDVSESPSISYPEIRLSATEKSPRDESTTIDKTATLGIDMSLSDMWQDISMDQPLILRTGDEALTFSLDFYGWDEATSTLGEEYTWTIYFGGIR